MLSLGARAVLLGRAWAWAVAAQGETGVRRMLKVIRADIDVALALTGNTSVADLNDSALYRGGAEGQDAPAAGGLGTAATQ
jgi:L-lactate dehydrogenase (cytochrome)